MRVFIERRRAKTGKGRFLRRLADVLSDNGVEIVRDAGDEADIYLDTGRFHCRSRARRWVLRLGSPHFDSSMDCLTLNTKKRPHFRRAEAVVYQSQFVRLCWHRFIGKHPREAVIFNGAPPGPGDHEPADCRHKTVFCAVARVWLPQKRLKDIINAFKLADIPGAGLYIAGEVLGSEHKYRCDNVRFMGHMGDIERLYAAADVLVHAVYLDACPNVVAEARARGGIRIICTDQGGTKEIAGPGTWLVHDKPWNYKPINLSKPPKLDREAMAEAMRAAVDNVTPVTIPDKININTVARQYMDYFRALL